MIDISASKTVGYKDREQCTKLEIKNLIGRFADKFKKFLLFFGAEVESVSSK